MQADNLWGAFHSDPPTLRKANVLLVEGVPGCGKTHEIIHTAEVGDLGLTVVKEANLDTSKRIRVIHADDVTCRTVDSYLLNSRQPYSKVYLDTGLMCHPGDTDLVAAYTECQELRVYWDR